MKNRFKAIERARGLRRDGMTLQKIADTLKRENLTERAMSIQAISKWLASSKPIRRRRANATVAAATTARTPSTPTMLGGRHSRLHAASLIMSLPISADAKEAALAGIFQ